MTLKNIVYPTLIIVVSSGPLFVGSLIAGGSPALAALHPLSEISATTMVHSVIPVVVPAVTKPDSKPPLILARDRFDGEKL